MRYEQGDHPELDGTIGLNIAVNHAVEQRPVVERLRQSYRLFLRTLETIENQCRDDGRRHMRQVADGIKRWRSDLPGMPDDGDAYGLTEIMDDVRHLQPCVYDAEECAEQRMPIATLVRLVHGDALKSFMPEQGV